MIFTEVSSDPIDTAALLAEVGSNEDGAVLLFIGVVRDHAEGRKVKGMRYDAYSEMATEVLREIALEASIPLGTDRIAVAHRFGELKIGDISVGIAVSSPHRAEAYEVSRFVNEEIKKRLPVWKKEHYLDGVSEWVEGTIPPGAGLEDSTHVAPLTDEGLA